MRSFQLITIALVAVLFFGCEVKETPKPPTAEQLIDGVWRYTHAESAQTTITQDVLTQLTAATVRVDTKSKTITYSSPAGNFVGNATIAFTTLDYTRLDFSGAGRPSNENWHDIKVDSRSLIYKRTGLQAVGTTVTSVTITFYLRKL